MSSSKPRSWTAWVSSAGIAMALFAAISIGATVFVARRALGDASEVIARGEANALAAAIALELSDEGVPPALGTLERLLEDHRSQGLRYVALLERDPRRPAVEVGTAVLADVVPRPGEATVAGDRVRVTRPLGMRRGLRGGGSMLVLELEPKAVTKLRTDLTRVAVVATGASAVLIAIAIALSRTARRLAAVEERAVREQRLVALGSMSSVMAHELRNPLASLKGHAQLLVEDLEGKAKTKAERVVSEAERLEELTSSLLDFVRDGPMQQTEIAPRELVERALDHLPAERVDVVVTGAPERLFVDATRLARAVHNLVENALQAEDEGTVELRIGRGDSGWVEIAVRDRGPGLAPGTTDQIFEPFVTTRVRGTGLGLAVARRIAEQHRGTVTAANHPDGGAVFCLRFPERRS